MKLSGELEIDEALFCGHRKGKRGWGSEGKSLVFGIYQRNDKFITFPASDRNIFDSFDKRTTTYQDRFLCTTQMIIPRMRHLNLTGKHQMILHGKEEYVRDDASHINGIDGFWSYAKTWHIIIEEYPNNTLTYT